MEVPALDSEVFHALATGQLTPSGHILLGWSAHKIEYQFCLVKIAVSSEDRLALKHFAKHAANSP
jgi:hypothetical protein